MKSETTQAASRCTEQRDVGCPHCGSKDGYYTVIIVRYDKYFTWSGEENGASEGKHVSGGKQARCESCNHIVTPNSVLDGSLPPNTGDEPEYAPGDYSANSTKKG